MSRNVILVDGPSRLAGTIVCFIWKHNGTAISMAMPPDGDDGGEKIFVVK